MRFEGNQTLADVVTQVNRAREFVGGAARCTVQSVVVRAPEQWFNHVTLIRVGLAVGQRLEEDVLVLRGATLVTVEQDLSSDISVDEFIAIATRWQEVVRLPEPRGLQDRATVSRHASDSRDEQHWPFWDCYLNERPSSNGPSAALPGPYRDPTRKFFARSLGDLTVRWLGRNDWANEVNVQQQYRLTLEDRRGRLKNLRASKGRLLVSVSGLNDEALCCAVEATSSSGISTAVEREVVVEGEIAIAVDLRNKDRLEVLLTAPDGERLDVYEERAGGWATWGPERALLPRRSPITDLDPTAYLADSSFDWGIGTVSPQQGAASMSVNSQTIQDHGSILPPVAYENTRGYVENLAKQINRSYEENVFDGAAVLMRRLEEVLLILAYEHLKIDHQIRDKDGHYLPLEGIVGNAMGNSTLNLSRNARQWIDVFRKLGNYSAHKITYTCRREYIREKLDDYRALIDELLHKAGLRT